MVEVTGCHQTSSAVVQATRGAPQCTTGLLMRDALLCSAMGAGFQACSCYDSTRRGSGHQPEPRAAVR